MQTITDMAFVNGNLMVAGLSNEEWSSALRSIPYPFKDAAQGATLQIWHSSHGRYETAAPVRTFVPYTISGQQYILAAYTCTPLVKIPVSDLKPGAKVKGVEIADLGAGNQPLDMVPYKKDGHDYILIANCVFGVVKLKADNLETYPAIDSPTSPTLPACPMIRSSSSRTFSTSRGSTIPARCSSPASPALAQRTLPDRRWPAEPANHRAAISSASQVDETQACRPRGHPLLLGMTAAAQAPSFTSNSRTASSA